MASQGAVLPVRKLPAPALLLIPAGPVPTRNPSARGSLAFKDVCTQTEPRMQELVRKIEADGAARLPLPPGRQATQELARYKAFLKVETHRLKIGHRAGGSGVMICRARAAMLD